MAAEDNKVILNPYSDLTEKERQSVVVNETARILMRQDDFRPDFDLTEEQKKFLNSTNYKDASPEDKAATIAGRILSGDPTAGSPTKQQLDFVNKLYQQLFNQNNTTIESLPENLMPFDPQTMDNSTSDPEKATAMQSLDGKVWTVPSVWYDSDNNAYEVPQDVAARLAYRYESSRKDRGQFPRFNSQKEAAEFLKNRNRSQRSDSLFEFFEKLD